MMMMMVMPYYNFLSNAHRHHVYTKKKQESLDIRESLDYVPRVKGGEISDVIIFEEKVAIFGKYFKHVVFVTCTCRMSKNIFPQSKQFVVSMVVYKKSLTQ